MQNCMIEWSFKTAKKYKDPFNEIELSAVFTGPDGQEKTVPGFWSGENVWRIRYASPLTGKHTYRTICTDTGDKGLHGKTGVLEIAPYKGENPLLAHGPVSVSDNRRYLRHYDGKPFFWLGDTWWMGLCKRLGWPDDFYILAADREIKGFTVVQIVAGLYPDMPAFDERGANEAGFPWTKDYKVINPAYFDMADRRIQHLVDSGMVPCIVGCWGYFLTWMGVEKMKKHWRYLVARYGAHPVVWCLAGEGIMPYYLSATREEDSAAQKKGWTEVGRYMRKIDPYRRPVTIHPGTSARDTVEDPAVLDFDMLQTGHGDRGSLPNTVAKVSRSYHTTPVMPVINGEVCYEGIGEFCRQEVQRWMFWACLLTGAAGHTYGANGIWQVNTRRQPYGPSPHGMSWGNTPWEDACRLPGSEQVGIAKRLLEKYPWWEFEPHQEWVEPHWTEELYDQPYTWGRHDIPLAAGIPGRVRVIYVPMGTGLNMVKHLEQGVCYRLRLGNPVDGTELDGGEVKPDTSGNWVPEHPRQKLPIYQDWVFILEAT